VFVAVVAALISCEGFSVSRNRVAKNNPVLNRGRQEGSTPSTVLRATVSPLFVANAATVNGAAKWTVDSQEKQQLGKVQAALTKFGTMFFIASMCIALPATLVPQRLMLKLGIWDRVTLERRAVWTTQFCARWLLRLIPFCSISCTAVPNLQQEPSVWVCNHISMLDLFVLLGRDHVMRGRKRRPIKIVYWKQLEDNPVTKLMFRQSGFISVDMAPNAAGEKNEYDRSTFRKLLKDTKQAFKEGFDIGILPEGQLNPTPEKGLLEAFPGAYTLAKLAKRPIYMMALYGTHHLWAVGERGMEPIGRNVGVRVYPKGRVYKSAQDFVKTFTHVVGQFGKTGTDVPDLDDWLDGTAAPLQPSKEPPVKKDKVAETATVS